MSKVTKEDREKAGDARMVHVGGTVKSLGGNKIGGYAVVFTDEETPDLQGDFFTKATDFYIDADSSLPILYHHGLRGLGSMQLGKARCNIDDVGVWMEGELALRADYIKQLGVKKSKAIIKSLIEMIDGGHLGYSTGSMPHLVEVKAHENGTEEFLSWPIGEISLTPTPVGKETKAVTIKSYDEMPEAKALVCECEEGEECDCDKGAAKPEKKKALNDLLVQFIDDSADGDTAVRNTMVKSLAREALLDGSAVDAILSGATRPSNANLKAFARVLGVDFAVLRDLNKPAANTSIKGIFEEELANDKPSHWDLWSAYSCVVKKLVNAKVGADLAGIEFDYEAKIAEATTEYSAHLVATVKQQVADFLQSDYTDESFYLRALGDPSDDTFFSARNVAFEDHINLAVSAFKSVVERTRLNHNSRVKAGRTLSEKKLGAAFGYLDSIHAEETKARTFFESMKPVPTDTEKRKAMSDFLRNEFATGQIDGMVGTSNGRHKTGEAE